MGMSVIELVDYLRDKGPYDLPPSPTACQEDSPPLEDNTSEEEPIKDEGEPMEGEDPEENHSGGEEEPREEEDPEEDPSEDE